MDADTLLSDSKRTWYAVAGAAQADVERLAAASPVSLPQSLLTLLLASNGGEGPVALPPQVFVLDAAESIIEGIQDEETRANYPGFLFFGGNGGLERIALDLRTGSSPWPVVTLDPAAGPESAEQIAADFDSFLAAVGFESDDTQ
jgi:hypothetical protein